jgi:hypothetical protein
MARKFTNCFTSERPPSWSAKIFKEGSVMIVNRADFAPMPTVDVLFGAKCSDVATVLDNKPDPDPRWSEKDRNRTTYVRRALDCELGEFQLEKLWLVVVRRTQPGQRTRMFLRWTGMLPDTRLLQLGLFARTLFELGQGNRFGFSGPAIGKQLLSNFLAAAIRSDG